MILDQRVPDGFTESPRIQQMLRQESPTGFDGLDDAGRHLLFVLTRGVSTVDAAKEPSLAHLGKRRIKTLRAFIPRLVGAQTLDQTIYLGLRHGVTAFECVDPAHVPDATLAQSTALGLAALGFNRPASAKFQFITQQAVANNRAGLFDGVVVIGDQFVDAEFAHNIGCSAILVARTGNIAHLERLVIGKSMYRLCPHCATCK